MSIDYAINEGLVPGRGVHETKCMRLVNFGALMLKMVGIQAIGGTFSLVFAIKSAFWRD